MAPNVAPEALAWKYWQPYAEWPDSRSFVLSRGETLFAHCAVIARRCCWGTSQIQVVQPIDWAARVGAGGAGVTLMKKLRQKTQLLLSVGGSEDTIRIVPHMGFRQVGEVTGYARPLHPLKRRGGAALMVLPRMARAFAWQLTAPAASSADWLIERVLPEQLARLAPVFPKADDGMVILERSAELFHYVLSCPIVPFSLYSVARSGRLRGYFLLSSVPGQVRIADCWIDSHDPADWRALILCAAAKANEDPEAAEVVIWASDKLLADALSASGFRARFRVPIQILPGLDGSVLPLAPRVQLLDNDSAFLNAGQWGFWA
jgi:hypothetical protein